VSIFDLGPTDLVFGTVVGVTFAKAFRRHVDCPDLAVDGDTVRAALDAYFAEYPAVRSYVLDDAGAVRKHVAVFHNDDLIVDRSRLSDAVADGDRLQIFQALSGG
jgi:molybdopterin converting factor small subunit